MKWSDENIAEVLSASGVVVMPTDTIYGIVGRAEDVAVVERIYNIRKRAPEKPCIILIGDVTELSKFSITLSSKQRNELEKYWFTPSGVEGPGPVSIVLDCSLPQFSYLHRGTKTLAFRLPAQAGLQKLLKKIGPLIAPSANIEGLPPAQNVTEARKYFGEEVDLYVDGEVTSSKPSKIIRLHQDGSIYILRE